MSYCDRSAKSQRYNQKVLSDIFAWIKFNSFVQPLSTEVPNPTVFFHDAIQNRIVRKRKTFARNQHPLAYV